MQIARTQSNLKIFIRTCLQLLLALTFFAPSLDGQIVRNPEFEDGWNEWYGNGQEDLEIVPDGHESSSACLVSGRDEFWKGISQDITGRLQPGTDYHIQCWVRTLEQPAGRVKFEFRQVDDRGTRFVTAGEVIATNDQWTLLEGGFRYQENGTVSDLSFTINGILGDSSLHDFLIDSVSITENDWKAAADARIEAFRKRDVLLELQSADGSPVGDLEVQVQQINHRFGFGSTLNDRFELFPQYRQFFVDNFNWGTVEGFVQWVQTEPSQDVIDFTKGDAAVEFAQANGIRLRGHALGWSNPEYIPAWLPALSDGEVGEELDERIETVVTRYKGRLVHWDVCNEMLNFSFFSDRLGSSIRSWMFLLARSFDPDVVLCTNEYGLNESIPKAKRYRELVQNLQLAGADVGSIGLQSHFFHGNTSPKGIELGMEQITDLDTEIWFTEFDVINPDPVERGAALVDFYRYGFSRPEVNGIIMWGFWAGTHWLGPDASLIDLDWNVNAAGMAYLDLIDQWTTFLTDNVSAAEPSIAFRGFHGNYLISVRNPQTDTISQHLVQVSDEGSDQQQIQLVIDDAPLDRLNVYGTIEDDLFSIDLERSNQLTINGLLQLLPQPVASMPMIFRGLGGEDRLVVNGREQRTRLQVRDSLMTDTDTGIEVGYEGIETVDFRATTSDDTVQFFDSKGDDTFVSHADRSSMSTPDTVLTAVAFPYVVARSVNGGVDSAQVFDSDERDNVYSNLRLARIRNSSSIRFAIGFDQTEVQSLQNFDTLDFQVLREPSSLQLSAGLMEASIVGRSSVFSGFRFVNLDFFPGQKADVLLLDSLGDDRLVIDPEILKFFGAGYLFTATGIERATALASAGGSDQLTIRDTSGGDQLTASGSEVGISGPQFDFSANGFSIVRASAINGGDNLADIGEVTFDLILRGDWQQQ